MANLATQVVRVAATAAHKLLKTFWFFRRPRTFGAHAIALTPKNKLILVRLRYAPGWRLPGGGRAEGEHAIDAALRELREEIGMTAHGQARLAQDFEEITDFKHDLASLVVVRDVEYRPRRWNWEVEAVTETSLDDLPEPLSTLSARWIGAVQAMI